MAHQHDDRGLFDAQHGGMEAVSLEELVMQRREEQVSGMGRQSIGTGATRPVEIPR